MGAVTEEERAAVQAENAAYALKLRTDFAAGAEWLVALMRRLGIASFKGHIPGADYGIAEFTLGHQPPPAVVEQPKEERPAVPEERGPDGLTRAEQELLYASTVG